MPEQPKHFAIYTVGTIVNIVASYAVLVLLTNQLSKESFATYGLFNTVFSLLLIFINFGAKESVFKYASTGNHSHLSASLSWFFCWQLVFLLGCLIVAIVNLQIALIATCFVVMSWLLVINGFNRGLGNYLKDAISLPIHRLAWLFGCILYIQFSADTFDYTIAFYTSLLATLITVLVVSDKRLFQIRFPNYKLLKPPEAFTRFFLIELAIVAYTKVDMLLLRSLGVSTEESANYYFSVQVLDAAVLILAPISYFFFNRFAKRQTEVVRDEALILKYAVAMVILVLTGQICWLGGGELILSWVFPQYVDSNSLINLFLFALYPVAINYILSSTVILSNNELPYAKLCGCAFLVYLLVSIVLVPEMEAEGAIVSRIITEFFIAVGLFIFYIRTRSHG
jgi:O-antigen/teichoic acid export membrane protein